MKRILNLKNTVIVLTVLLLGVACNTNKITVTDDPNTPIPNTDEIVSSSETLPSTPETTTTIPVTEVPETSETSETTTFQSETQIITSGIEENRIVLTAQALLGIPFVDGGDTPTVGFDSSGFIYYVLRENGYVNCPRGLQDQAVMGNTISSISDLKSGDLVFFSDSGERAEFGGIYIGDGKMIYSPMPGQSVKEIDITVTYFKNAFFTGVRVL